jgi:hypothetical protein
VGTERNGTSLIESSDLLTEVYIQPGQRDRDGDHCQLAGSVLGAGSGVPRLA